MLTFLVGYTLPPIFYLNGLILQAPDVSWNKPFKGCLKKLYNDWLENGNHTYTKSNNIRAPTKTDLADMVVKSWASLSEHLIENSFLACGQAKTCNPDLISCLKEGGQAADLLPQIQQIWNKNPEIVCSNPLEEECEEELARNEVVIFDE